MRERSRAPTGQPAPTAAMASGGEQGSGPTGGLPRVEGGMHRRESDDATRPGEVAYGAARLALAPGLPYARWETIGRALWAMEWGRLWWLGDWLTYGECAYGERAAQAEALGGYDYATLSAARWVCGRIAPDRRRPELSFAHHRQVAALAPAEQERWLTAAAREGWTLQELRAVLRAVPTPLEALRREWARATAEERAAFRAEVSGLGG